jgi:hypothetical protein
LADARGGLDPEAGNYRSHGASNFVSHVCQGAR